MILISQKDRPSMPSSNPPHLRLGQVHPRQPSRSSARPQAHRGQPGDRPHQHPRPALLPLKEMDVLNHPTLDRLHQMGLFGMAKAFADIAASDGADGLTHGEWLALLLDREWTYRYDKRLAPPPRAPRPPPP